MKRILFVDDDPFITRIYRSRFQTEGYTVDVAADGEEALAALEKVVPDLVVLDLQLPKKNGVEVLQSIRANPATKDLRVVVFSNAFMGTLMQDASNAGANKCLNKANCTPHQLIEVVRTTMAAPSTTPAQPAPSALVVQGKSTPPTAAAAPTPPALPAAAGRSVTPAEAGGKSAALIPANEALARLAVDSQKRAATVVPSTTVRRDIAVAKRPNGNGKAAKMAGATTTEPDALSDTSQALIREVVLRASPHTLSALRTQLFALQGSPERLARQQILGEMLSTMHAHAGNAGVAGFESTAKLASAVEALLQELQVNPAHVTNSTIVTLSQSVETLNKLLGHDGAANTDDHLPPLALIVDTDDICSDAVRGGLRQALVRSILLRNWSEAAHVVEQNPFDLIFLGQPDSASALVEIDHTIRQSAHNAGTPILHLTAAADIETRFGALDFDPQCLIDKPFLLLEIAVRSLTALIRRDL